MRALGFRIAVINPFMINPEVNVDEEKSDRRHFPRETQLRCLSITLHPYALISTVVTSTGDLMNLSTPTLAA